MKTVVYGAFLALLLVASIFLLRSIEPRKDDESPRRLAALTGGDRHTLDLGNLEGASAAELYSLGVDYLQFWRVRDATELLERAVAADSTHHGAWLKLVECYANPPAR